MSTTAIYVEYEWQSEVNAVCERRGGSATATAAKAKARRFYDYNEGAKRSSV